jgi:glutaredoxin 1
MDRYIIYGRSSCGYCTRACDLLESRAVDYVFLNMDEDPIGLKEAKDYYGHETVPVILSNNLSTGLVTLVGGYDDLLRSLVL